jgi:hypothetical protein
MKKLNGIHKNAALNVRTGAKAAGLVMNHSARALKVRAGVKAGGLTLNHSARVLGC